MVWKRLICTLVLGWIAQPTPAHEVRPAYLEVRESSAGHFDVLWKTPIRGGLRLRMTPRFAAGCQPAAPASGHDVPGAFVERQTLACPDGLVGREIAIEGLEATLIDVLVRLELLGGPEQTVRLRPARTSFVVAAVPSSSTVAVTYLGLGIEHIFGGIDHLLFVLGLLILVKGWRQLLAAVTAFTIAHSLTLAGAALGLVHLPSAPVEAVIALSILFLAAEIIRGQAGRVGLTRRHPWGVAFMFGLLHGFGFAGALTELGLPGHAVPLALLFFNLGVEVGQLVFVSAMTTALFLGRWFETWKPVVARPARVPVMAAYLIGTTAAFWTIQRVASFWS